VSPAKDLEKEAAVLPHEQRLAAARQVVRLTAEQAALLNEYAGMIEEFKVSLFAQELGTAFPVSAKRLEQKWEEIRGAMDVKAVRY
jgi:ATP-dependent helicase HrpA